MAAAENIMVCATKKIFIKIKKTVAIGRIL